MRNCNPEPNFIVILMTCRSHASRSMHVICFQWTLFTRASLTCPSGCVDAHGLAAAGRLAFRWRQVRPHPCSAIPRVFYILLRFRVVGEFWMSRVTLSFAYSSTSKGCMDEVVCKQMWLPQSQWSKVFWFVSLRSHGVAGFETHQNWEEKTPKTTQGKNQQEPR